MSIWDRIERIFSLGSYRDSTLFGRLVGGGLTGGAAFGGTVGAVGGFVNQITDRVSEVWKSNLATHPKLDGYVHDHDEVSHSESRCCIFIPMTSTDSNGNSTTTWVPTTYSVSVHDGWNHVFKPQITRQPVGEYKTPALEHSSKTGPLMGTLLGIGIGAGVGLGVGLLSWAAYRLSGGGDD